MARPHTNVERVADIPAFITQADPGHPSDLRRLCCEYIEFDCTNLVETAQYFCGMVISFFVHKSSYSLLTTSRKSQTDSFAETLPISRELGGIVSRLPARGLSNTKARGGHDLSRALPSRT